MQNARVVRGVPWQGVTLAFELALPSMGGARGVLARAGRCPRADPALVGLAGMRGPVPLARCASLTRSIITIVILPAEAAPAWMGLARRGMLGACRGPHEPGSVTGQGVSGRGLRAGRGFWAEPEPACETRTRPGARPLALAVRSHRLPLS